MTQTRKLVLSFAATAALLIAALAALLMVATYPKAVLFALVAGVCVALVWACVHRGMWGKK